MGRCRIRRFAIGLAVWACVAGVPSTPADEPPDCDSWNLEGYRLGMTLSQVSEIRAVKGKSEVFTTREKGRFKGQLRFDAGGRLVQSVVAYKHEVQDELRRRLSDLLGTPAVDRAHRGSEHIGPKFSTAWETEWTSAECNATLRLRQENIKVYTSGILQVDTDRIYLALVPIDDASSIDWHDVN